MRKRSNKYSVYTVSLRKAQYAIDPKYVNLWDRAKLDINLVNIIFLLNKHLFLIEIKSM